jgi:hypothetical protein
VYIHALLACSTVFQKAWYYFIINVVTKQILTIYSTADIVGKGEANAENGAKAIG